MAVVILRSARCSASSTALLVAIGRLAADPGHARHAVDLPGRWRSASCRSRAARCRRATPTCWSTRCALRAPLLAAFGAVLDGAPAELARRRDLRHRQRRAGGERQRRSRRAHPDPRLCAERRRSAAAGLFLAATATAGDATTGNGYTLTSIVAVVLGGVSLFGGRGSARRRDHGRLRHDDDRQYPVLCRTSIRSTRPSTRGCSWSSPSCSAWRIGRLWRRR